MTGQCKHGRIHTEDGSVMVVALMVLVLLTMLGISAVNNATLESGIVRNEIVHVDYFYRAESGVQEAIQRIESLPRELEDDTLPQLSNLETVRWIHPRATAPDFTDPANWNIDPVNGNALATEIDDVVWATNWSKYDTHMITTWIAVVWDGADSLDETQPALHRFTIFSMTNVDDGHLAGRVLLLVGHKRRV